MKLLNFISFLLFTFTYSTHCIFSFRHYSRWYHNRNIEIRQIRNQWSYNLHIFNDIVQQHYRFISYLFHFSFKFRNNHTFNWHFLCWRNWFQFQSCLFQAIWNCNQSLSQYRAYKHKYLPYLCYHSTFVEIHSYR